MVVIISIKLYRFILMPCLIQAYLSVVAASRGLARSHHSYEEISSSLVVATAFCLLTIKTLSGAYIKCILEKLSTSFVSSFNIFFYLPNVMIMKEICFVHE